MSRAVDAYNLRITNFVYCFQLMTGIEVYVKRKKKERKETQPLEGEAQKLCYK